MDDIDAAGDEVRTSPLRHSTRYTTAHEWQLECDLLYEAYVHCNFLKKFGNVTVERMRTLKYTPSGGTV
jgi:hypothetical protein